jgi:hypothetical protein
MLSSGWRRWHRDDEIVIRDCELAMGDADIGIDDCVVVMAMAKSRSRTQLRGGR